MTASRKAKVSNRELVRSRRQQQSRRRLLFIIGGIIIVAVIIVAVLVLPNLQPIPDVTVPAFTDPKTSNGLTMGDPNAPVKIEEFADFQCPACKNLFDAVHSKLVNDYINTGKVFYTFTPFSFIDQGRPAQESHWAAEAGYCAGDQGKFWEFYQTAYSNQLGENIGTFSTRRLQLIAQKIGLNMSDYNSCFDSGKYRQRVVDDYGRGTTMGVNSTPTIFLNGQLFTFKNAYEELYTAIDAAAPATK